MAKRMNFAAALAVVVVLAASLLQNTSAATYVVGDSLGWQVPTSDPSAYTTWAARQNFTVGDILVFNFATGLHDVARVTREAFDACNTANPISTVTVGPANVALNATGEYYFICTVGQHCSLGQKLAINIASTSGPTASPPPPPSTPTSPPPAPSPPTPGSVSPPPAPTPPPGTTSPPPPPPPSAAMPTAVATFSVIFMSIAIAVLC